MSTDNRASALQVQRASIPWLLPLVGIHYFARHRFLWPLMRSRLLPCILLSAFVFITLFLFTYLPQVAFLAIFHSKGAWLNATFLVLGEGAAITALLFEAFLVDKVLADLFDSVASPLCAGVTIGQKLTQGFCRCSSTKAMLSS